MNLREFILVVLLFVSVQAIISQDSQYKNNILKIGLIEVNYNKGILTFPAKVNMTNGLIEVLLCSPIGKTHESFLVTSITPVELQTSLILLGCTPANDYYPSDQSFVNPNVFIKNDSLEKFKIYIVLNLNSRVKITRIEKFIIDKRNGKRMWHVNWLFKGLQQDENNILITGNQITMVATYYDPYAVMVMYSEDLFDDTLFLISSDSLVKHAEVKVIIKKIRNKGKT